MLTPQEYAYWLGPPPSKPEGFKAWEKRHVPCLQTRNGKLFYDWHAAKKVGKRNGEVPRGLTNGIIGKLVHAPHYNRRMVELYNVYYDEFSAMGFRVPHGKTTRFVHPIGFDSFAHGILNNKCRLNPSVKEWADAWREQHEGAYRTVLEAPDDEFPVVAPSESPVEKVRKETTAKGKVDALCSALRTESIELQKYEAYALLMVANGIRPRTFEAWVENYRRVNA